MEKLKKDIVVIALIIGVLLFSAVLFIVLRICERGRNTKSYLRRDWEMTRKKWACKIARLRKERNESKS